MRTAWLIFNPRAGRGDAGDLGVITCALAPHFDIHVVLTSLERDADRCAREAVEAGADLVIASGGDGTVSLAASALIGSAVPLGIIPRGTASSIATALGIPTDLEAACHNLLFGEVHRIDTANAGGRTMVLLASVGLHADTVNEASRDAKNKWGLLAYVAQGLQQIRELEPFEVEIETEREVLRSRATAVTVANVAPPQTVLAQGPSVISPVDGALDVTIVSTDSAFDVVATGVHLYRTATKMEPATREGVGYLECERIRIVTDRPRRVLIDGEDGGTTPLEIECLPKSLAVVLPAPPQQKPARAPQADLDNVPGLQRAEK